MGYDRANGGPAALGFARELDGKPYVYGGVWPQDDGTDCSGLWEWGYDQIGVYLPRTTYEQFKIAQIPRSWPSRPADLLFIRGADPGPNGEPGHVMGYVAPGRVFQAEETGTLIGEFPYDTEIFDFRTRPSLLLPMPPVAPKPVPHSPAAELGADARPLGPIQLLVPGEPCSQEWVEYERKLGRVIGLWPRTRSITRGGYGTKSQDLTVASKDHFGIPMDGTKGDRVCGARVFNAYGVR